MEQISLQSLPLKINLITSGRFNEYRFVTQKSCKVIGEDIIQMQDAIITTTNFVCDVKFIHDKTAESSLEACHGFNFLSHFYVSSGSSF